MQITYKAFLYNDYVYTVPLGCRLMIRKSIAERNTQTNHSIRAKRKSAYSFRFYAVIGSRTPFCCWFPCHGTPALRFITSVVLRLINRNYSILQRN